MEVKLLSFTPEPEKVVAAAARICYSSQSGAAIADSFDEDKAEEFIAKLIQLGHFSPFEHASFTFAIDGVSRSLSHQLVRHRIASYSQKSQRYVKENGFAYVTPKSITASPQQEAEYKSLMEQIQQAYNALLAAGIPAEDARYILPNATETNLVVTMNARSLLNFFQLRCCRRAQTEIRQLAWQMLKQVRQVAPMLFANAGPTCLTLGICYEGAMSCRPDKVEIITRSLYSGENDFEKS